MSACYLCGGGDLRALLDVDQHPISNRFLARPSDESPQFRISLKQCETCGLVQVPDPVDQRELPPPYDWISYSEPEGHLDEMVERLVHLPCVRRQGTVAGISFKDDSTLARLERRGYSTWRLDMASDLGVPSPRPGFGAETIQAALTPAIADEVARRRGHADVAIARHIFEHAYAPLSFLEALGRLVPPGGAVVLEVPDCTKAFERFDYTTLWEEHTMYFTPVTLQLGLELNGFRLEQFNVYPYPFESSIVAVAAHDGSSRRDAAVADGAIEAERRRARQFADARASIRSRVRTALEAYRRRGKIALFGAGHLAVTYLAVFGIADLIDCVVDDSPHKRGLYMPASRLPIVGSNELAQRGISLCLLSLNPLGEAVVIERNAAFVERGGQFASIFPASARALAI